MSTLRVCFQGQHARSARLLEVAPPPAERERLSGGVLLSQLLDAGYLCIAPGHEHARWRPLYYDEARHSWAQLTASSELEAKLEIQIELEDASTSTYWTEHPSRPREEEGYFAVGIVRGKKAENHGTVWRSAYQMGAAFTFTIGARFSRQAADTTESWKEVPAFHFADFDGFALSAPFGAQMVAVEMGGTPLHEFVHPTRAVYLLGAEDGGLSSAVCRAAHHRITIPSVRTASFNVAVAASIVMYDRLCKTLHPSHSLSLPEKGPPASNGRTPAPLHAPLLHKRGAPELEGSGENRGGCSTKNGELDPERRKEWGHGGEQCGSMCSLLQWCSLRVKPDASASELAILVRSSRVFKQRLQAYCSRFYGLKMQATATDLLLLCQSTSGNTSTHELTSIWRTIREDAVLRRALEDVYLISHVSRDLEQTVQAVSSAVALIEKSGSPCVLRLQVHPRSFRSLLEERLPPSLSLHPKAYTHLFFAVQVKGMDHSESTPFIIHSLQSADLLGMKDCSKAVGSKLEAMLLVQEDWKLHSFGWVVAILQLGSSARLREDKVHRLKERLNSIGIASSNVSVEWLFANGP
ncbi:MAG: hypothetical protein SGPRY_013014, partial [Prymnesium sp.]